MKSQRKEKSSEATTTVLLRGVPREKYRQFRVKLLKHGLTVASWFRQQVEKN